MEHSTGNAKKRIRDEEGDDPSMAHLTPCFLQTPAFIAALWHPSCLHLRLVRFLVRPSSPSSFLMRLFALPVTIECSMFLVCFQYTLKLESKQQTNESKTINQCYYKSFGYVRCVYLSFKRQDSQASSSGRTSASSHYLLNAPC